MSKGFNMGGMNRNQMIAQARKMQQQLMEAQQKVSELEVSTSAGGGAGAASTPATTSRTSSESVTQEHARSAASTASATDGAGAAGRSRAREGERAYSTTSWPAAARFRTIPEPISPAPTKPIRTRATIPAGRGRERGEGRPDARPR